MASLSDLWQSLRALRTSAETEARAIQLMVQLLSPAQREQYETSGCFDVIGGDSGTRYRISVGSQMNVEQLDDSGRRSKVACFMPRGDLPVGYVMLAQKIALELFEPEAIGVANRLGPSNPESMQQA